MSARRPLLATTLALILSVGCGAAAFSPTATAATVSPPAPVNALATDQPCTRHAPAGVPLARVPYRTDDLLAMTLPKDALAAAVAKYSIDWFHWGFMDNVELRHLDFAPANLCSINRTDGRITGFSRAYVGPKHFVATATHLFFSGSGAQRWLSSYVAGTKALAGHDGVRSVSAHPLSGPGTDAVRLDFRMSDASHRSQLLFRQQTIVGSVVEAHAAGVGSAIDVRSAARRLDDRIVQRSATVAARGPDRFDAVMAVSAGLPRSMLGARYRGLVWDWYYGGCWDPQEAATQSSLPTRQHYLADAARYGQLTFCRAMYVPPNNQQSMQGVERAFTGGTLYATAAGASGAIAETVRDWKSRAGHTGDGTSYGPLLRFNPGDVGTQAVGLRQRIAGSTAVRILFRTGRYVGVAQASGSSSGMVDSVRRWSAQLDRRIDRLLTTRVP